MSELAVEMNHVNYVYPDGHVALEDVNLRITRSEKLAILGPNGAGKSTLLMILNGLYKSSKGKVNVLDAPANDENLGTVRRDVGLVFQDPDDQLFSPTLWEDVCFGPLNMGLPKEEVMERSIDALKAVGLEGYEEKPPHHLSAGEKKRAAIATVIAMRPKILLLDEPTANLDPRNRFELTNLLRNLHSSYHITLITATHDVNFVPEVAETLCILNKGHIIAQGSPRQIFSDLKIMREANLEPPIVTRLFNALAEENGNQIDPIPLTVEEAVHELNRCYKFSLNKNA